MTRLSASLTATRIPGIGVFKLPLTRNDLMLILVGFNLIAVGFETYLAHMISGHIKPAEAIPVVLGPLAGLIVFAALYLRLIRKAMTTSTLIIIGAASLSIVVGILGTAFHSDRALAPSYLPGSSVRWDWLIYAPPIAAPLAFCGIGLMAIVAALEDTKPESGQLTLPGILTFRTPMTQTTQLLWLVTGGLYGSTLSAFLDHGRTQFENIFVWIPVFLGLFGAIVTTLLAVYKERSNADFFVFFWVMMLMVLVGVFGMGLHINADLPEGGAKGGLVTERFISGAPVLAPMLFANMGLLGIITMVGAETSDPKGENSASEA
ncbi:MAG: hypothetical protein HY862_04955 [Chloroflexi bacterium]|nr:hypothetical protein [Chloroflexota bacterium]